MDGVLFPAPWSDQPHVDPPEVKQPIAFTQSDRKAVGYSGAANIDAGRFIHYRAGMDLRCREDLVVLLPN
jgi:hypothetical protein